MIGTGLPFDKNFNLQLQGGAVLAANSGAPELRDRPFLQAEAFTTTLDFDTGARWANPSSWWCRSTLPERSTRG